MIRIRRGTVLSVVAERAGALELSVSLEGSAEHESAAAVAYPELVGGVRPGDRVLLNTTAGALGLGTGGFHFVMAVDGMDRMDATGPGRTMKLRYTPQQLSVLAVEEEASPHRAAMRSARDLAGVPVVWIPLHSMLAPVAAGARAAGAERVAYVMTGGAALPVGLSRLVDRLRRATLLDAVVSSGQAFGGDLEAVTTFSGLLAARHVIGADVIVVGDGPGNTGTDTPWGTSALDSAHSLNAAGVLGGRPVAALRISFADARPRHRPVSHHSLTALSRVALVPVHVAVPVIGGEDRRAAVWASLREAGLQDRHQLVEVTGEPAMVVLGERGVDVDSMGRRPDRDPEFFLAAGAAGVLAGRMAQADRAWGRGKDPAGT